MKTFTLEDIRSWEPCYDPSRYLPKDWSGTALDLLSNENIPPNDRIWTACHVEVIDARTLRLFAVWCARQVQHLMDDPRSINALDVSERYANGEATEEDLTDARNSALEVARPEVMYAWVVSWAVTEEASWAAWASAWSSACALACDAARGIAWNADWIAAWDAVWAAQVAKLIEMVSEVECHCVLESS